MLASSVQAVVACNETAPRVTFPHFSGNEDDFDADLLKQYPLKGEKGEKHPYTLTMAKSYI